MVDCRELSETYSETNATNNIAFDFSRLSKDSWLCPHALDSLKLIGSFGSEIFTFVKIAVHGCDLAEMDCAKDDELKNVTINYVQVHAYPDLLTEGSRASPIRFQMEFSRYFNILPDTEISENVYFMENTITLQDNYIDILEIDERDLTFFEEEKTERLYKRFKSNTPTV